MITQIINYFANTIASIFNAFDNNKFEGISILDMYIAIMWLKITIWFVMAVLRKNKEKDKEE